MIKIDTEAKLDEVNKLCSEILFDLENGANEQLDSKMKHLRELIKAVKNSGSNADSAFFAGELTDIKKHPVEYHGDDEEPDDWITVNGNHIPVDEDNKPIGGQMKAIGGNEKRAGKKSIKKSTYEDDADRTAACWNSLIRYRMDVKEAIKSSPEYANKAKAKQFEIEKLRKELRDKVKEIEDAQYKFEHIKYYHHKYGTTEELRKSINDLENSEWENAPGHEYGEDGPNRKDFETKEEYLKAEDDWEEWYDNYYEELKYMHEAMNFFTHEDYYEGKVQYAKEDKAEIEKKIEEAKADRDEYCERAYRKLPTKEYEKYKKEFSDMFPTLDDCNAPEDYSGYLVGKGYFYGEDSNPLNIDLGSNESNRLICEKLDSMFTDYPSLVGVLHPVEILDESEMGDYEKKYGYFYGLSCVDKVRLNYDFKDSRRSYDSCIETGFHPQGTDYADVIVHEYAHQIESYLNTNKRKSGQDKVGLAVLKHVMEETGKPLDEVLGFCGYAAKNKGTDEWDGDINHDTEYGIATEFLAETFMAYRAGSENPIVVSAGKEFERYIRGEK